MAARFPAQYPNLPNLATISQAGTTFANVNLSNERTRQWMADVSAEVIALAARVGVTGTSDSTTLLYQVAHAIPNDVSNVQVYRSGAWNVPLARQTLYIVNQSDPDPT